MKIAVVTATFPPYHGGSGNVAYHNARILQGRGHDTKVFTPKHAVQSQAHPYGFEVEYLPAWIKMGKASLLPGLVGRLKGFDLIHLHYPFIFGAELACLASRAWHIPLVVTYHNRLEEQHFAKKLLFYGYTSLMEPFLLSQASTIIAVSQDHLSSVHPGLRAVEVPNGVDINHYTPGDRVAARKALGLDQSESIVLFVGALDQAHRFKNVPLLLNVVAALPGVKCVIAGDGDQRMALADRANGMGIGHRVLFAGSPPSSELPTFYRAADVTVLPSSSLESFGMVLVESMACSTPVIATDLPGVRTVVRHEKTGLLVTPGDHNTLKAALLRLLSSPTKRAAMGAEGRRRVEMRYSWEKIAEQLEAAMMATVDRSGTPQMIPSHEH